MPNYLKYLLLLSIFFLEFAFTSLKKEVRVHPDELYRVLSYENKSIPENDVFQKAMHGFLKLEKRNYLKKNILTIIDYGLASDQKRLWVIDVENQKVLFNTLVAHGKESGAQLASQFSNKPESHKTCLGFFVTKNTYYGKHGLSLNLIGMEEGFNDNALKRRIVVHGADYVSEKFVENNGRLGRSFGCPALPNEVHDQIIHTIKEGSCIFAFYPDQGYLSASEIIN